MESSQNRDLHTDRITEKNYFKATHSSNVSTQISVVRRFIRHFSNQNDEKRDILFLDAFPIFLFKSLVYMSNGSNTESRIDEKKHSQNKIESNNYCILKNGTRPFIGPLWRPQFETVILIE
ncbi:hypothetical protein RF11_07494 [Thelohanellus kitauei]|uniref:Uncharacterized protein n=1 Tax=Thelohanellus kitauei TaxID=669202 RepID=A0A0C2N7K2_THEKT|nr:hypothetical protein RF11_07494 [Thelohanellus kitauei]